MNFLNPLALFGLAAASIPLILHLLNLRKLKTVEFSSLRFLKELQKTKIRRLKLKQLLLLILRTLIIIFAVLAFARPAIKSSLPVLSSDAKTSAVIILDNSFSMDISDEYGNRFNQAKNAAKQIINNLADGDEANIIPMADGAYESSAGLARNKAILQKDLSKINISNTSANIRQPLALANKLLAESVNLNKELYIITDAQSNIFRDEIKDSISKINSASAVYFIPIGGGAETDVRNLSIDSIKVNTGIFRKDKQVEVEVFVRNNSGKDISGIIAGMYFNKNRVAQRTIDLPAKEVRQITISAAPQSYGINKAYIELEADALDIDNKRYFGFIIPPKPNAAIFGSSDVSSFINYVLSGSSANEPNANTFIFSPSQASGVDLAKYEIIICAGGPYKESDFIRLEQYVRKGGSLLIFADERTGMETFKNGLSKLGFGSVSGVNFPDSEPASFSSVDKMHPIFEGVFKGTTDSREIVESAKIYKALPNGGGQLIIGMPGGAFLSESRLDEGKAIYCAVSPDLDWSSFPVTGLFPVLVYRSIAYLSSRESMGSNVIAGNSFMFQLPKKFASGSSFKVSGPDNTLFYKQAVMLPSGANLSFENSAQLGNYGVLSPQDKPVAVVSVNPEPSESILNIFDADKILNALKPRFSDGTVIEVIEGGANILAGVNRAKTGSELWQLFLVLALLSAFAEMIVAKSSKSDIGE